MSLFSSKSGNVGLGIRLSDTSVELVEVECVAKGSRVTSFARVMLDAGLVEKGDIKDVPRAAGVLRGLLKQTKPVVARSKDAFLVLPDRLTYFHRFRFPGSLSEVDIKNALPFSAEELLPVTVSEMSMDFRVLSRTSTETIVLATFVQKQILQKYLHVVEQAGLKLRWLGIEADALSHVVLGDAKEGKASMVVDIGATSTVVFFRDEHGLRATFSKMFGSESFTNELAETLDIDPKEAKHKKKTKGVLVEKPTAQSKALERGLSDLAQLLRPIHQWFLTSCPDVVLEEIVFSGEGSDMPGFLSSLKALVEPWAIGVSVRIADTSVHFQETEALTLLQKQASPSVFSSALGTALTGLSLTKNCFSFYGGVHAFFPVGDSVKERVVQLWQSNVGQKKEKVKTFAAVLFLLVALGGLSVLGWMRYQQYQQAGLEVQQIEATQKKSSSKAKATKDTTSSTPNPVVAQPTVSAPSVFQLRVGVKVEEGVVVGRVVSLPSQQISQTVTPMYSEIRAGKTVHIVTAQDEAAVLDTVKQTQAEQGVAPWTSFIKPDEIVIDGFMTVRTLSLKSSVKNGVAAEQVDYALSYTADAIVVPVSALKKQLAFDPTYSPTLNDWEIESVTWIEGDPLKEPAKVQVKLAVLPKKE